MTSEIIVLDSFVLIPQQKRQGKDMAFWSLKKNNNYDFNAKVMDIFNQCYRYNK